MLLNARTVGLTGECKIAVRKTASNRLREEKNITSEKPLQSKGRLRQCVWLHQNVVKRSFHDGQSPAKAPGGFIDGETIGCERHVYLVAAFASTDTIAAFTRERYFK